MAQERETVIIKLLTAIFVLIAVLQFYGLGSENGIALFQPGANPELAKDFLAYYDGARAVLSGEFPYAEHSKSELKGFVYTPPSLFLFLPFGAVPLEYGWLAWQAVSVLALAVTMHFFARHLSLAQDQRGLLMAFSFACQPTFRSFAEGQVNLIIVSALLFLLMARHARPLLGGAALALAASIKIFPALIGLLFLRNPLDRLVVYSALFVGIVASLYISMVTTPDILWLYFFDFLPGTSEISQGNIDNQSLPGFAMRMMRPVEHWASWDAMRFDLPRSILLLNYALLLGAGVLAAWRCSRTSSPSVHLVMGLAVMACLPLFSQRGWSHLYVLALPLVLYHIACSTRRTVSALATFCALVFLMPINPHFVKLHWGVAFFLYNGYFITTALLVLLTLISPLHQLDKYIPNTIPGGLR